MVQKIRKERVLKSNVTKNKLNSNWRIKGRNKLKQLKEILNKLDRSRNPRDQRLAQQIRKENSL